MSLIWGLYIVLYSFITGLVLGSYAVSILPTLFKKRELESISLLSMTTAWGFLLASPIPLILDLGSPYRSINIYVHPTSTSVMALFGYIWIIFVLLLTSQLIMYSKYKSAPWFPRSFQIISVVGLLLALTFGGYFGFVLGSMKAKEIWSSALTPITTILSGLSAGAALVTFITIITMRGKVEKETLNSLNKYTLYFLSLYLVLTLVELVAMAYESPIIWSELSVLFSTYLAPSFIVVQYIIGGLLPILILLSQKTRTIVAVSLITPLLILAGVYSYKWNLIIGGQLIVETSPQFYSILSFAPTFIEILASIGTLSLAVFLYVLGLTIFPTLKVGGEKT